MTSFDLWSALPGCGQEEADHGHCTNSMQLPLYRAAPQSDLTHLCFLSHAIIIVPHSSLYCTIIILLCTYTPVYFYIVPVALSGLISDHLPHPVYTRLSLVL